MAMSHKKFIWISVFLLLVLTVGAVKAQGESVLVIGWDQEPGQLNPMVAMVQATNLEEFYARDVWNWDYDRNIYPVMVEEVPTVANGLVTSNDKGNTVVTYKLRQGMKWSDGEPITADDCLFWHQIEMNPSTSVNFARNNYPSVVESADKIDDYTFTMTYNQPYPDYLVDSA